MVPFGNDCEFETFDDCVTKMSGKVDDPKAYCGTLQRDTEEKCKQGRARAACAGNHIGLWAIEPGWFQAAFLAVKDGTWPIQARDPEEVSPRDLPPVTSDGIAVIEINGQMTKGWSKYGGTSTLYVRRQLRAAARSEQVRGVMLVVDSPGGFVAGTTELADDVRETIQTWRKPVRAHIDDLGASAAYWVASQATWITAGRTSEVGSIGSMAIVVDSSESAKMEGIKVHVLSTGKFKGDRVPGTKVTGEQLAEVQARVDDVNVHFLDAVTRGRNATPEQIEQWTTGQVWIAEKAKTLGLIDQVTSLDNAMESFRSELIPQRDFRSGLRSLELRQIESRLFDIYREK
jgi:signal peptide peptidase SppA